MGALQYISTSALSLTLSGNTGVGPFLTLFIIGVIEKWDPNLLYMDGWVETILASWPGLVLFGCLTILEFVGKCVPVVDAAIDSAMTFVVPIFSIMGSFASFGLFTAPSSSDDAPGMDEDGSRRLSGGGGTSGFLIFLQVMLCSVGVILALLVHLCKLLIRLMGEGCCTCCITCLEYAWILASVTLCIFIVPIAIGAALLLMVAAGFGFKSWWEKRQKKKKEGVAAVAEGGGGGEGGTNSSPSGQQQKGTSSRDEEQGKQQQHVDKEYGTAEQPSLNPSNTTTAEGNSKDDMHQPLLP